eukprot:TRINITY_DN5205_c0_g1_i1.p3 TRINITY_DN5205_c0_g1~~TRINITY_DN5205_c0_g1_i1.p3  ORF type:complete len:106 (-),score=10.64 TRINITY_DN5205_c0_g1_i1:507-824(-)
MMVWAVGKVQAVIPALNTCLQPLITVTMVALVFNQYLAVRDFLSMSLIILGLLVVVWAKFNESSDNLKSKGDRKGEFQKLSQKESSCNEDDNLLSKVDGSIDKKF